MAKNTIFSTKTTLNCLGRLLDLSSPVIIGIINVTPDSFYDGGALDSEAKLFQHAEKMLKEGATILDVGGMSSRPGAKVITEEEELQRIVPAITSLKKNFPEALISIDTWRSNVVIAAINEGAVLVNDISAGTFDDQLWKTVSRLKVPYILMHMKGTPENMQADPVYDDVLHEVIEFFKEKILQLRSLGIYEIILDPGFGFGKTVEHNFRLLNDLDIFRMFELPVMAGLSRKSLICKVLKVNPDKALNGTSVLNTIALIKGANILRVHDVREANETIQLVETLKNAAV